MTNPATLMRNLKVALDRRDRVGVNRACRALIASRAPLGGQWRSIASVLIENGEMTDARRAIDVLVTATSHSALGRFVQAETYAKSGRVEEAYTIVKSLPRNIPDPLSNAYTLGTIAINLGQFDDAREHLRRAVGLSPRSGQSWLALASAGKLDTQDADLMLSVCASMAGTSDGDRGAYFYALGTLLHDSHDYNAAFEAFAQGAAIEQLLRPVDVAADRKGFVAAREGWSASALAALSRPGRISTRPIFVTGLPRSGTTLVEQILASHKSVDGGDELDLFRHLISEIGGADFASVAAADQAGKFDMLVGVYDHLLVERFPGTDHVVDKSLHAGRYMGLLAALFPDAPVVWLRRDPLDNAWSIFRTYFRAELGWSFDLRAIADEMRREDILFEHWRRERPDQILAVDYAELATDPERVVPRIVEHCGLKIEPQQLRPHESKRTVTTASVAQVRAPINTGAIGAAAPYRRYLQPFIDAYTAAGGTID